MWQGTDYTNEALCKPYKNMDILTVAQNSHYVYLCDYCITEIWAREEIHCTWDWRQQKIIQIDHTDSWLDFRTHLNLWKTRKKERKQNGG